MLPGPGEVLHFSEDPRIERFEPHVASTARQPHPFVWAVDARHAPSYWFPRQCPRVATWVVESTTVDDRNRILGVDAMLRMHAIEAAWMPAVARAELWAYRFDREAFRPFEDGHAWVAEVAVEPLGAPEPVGDLVALHRGAGIELRILPDLWGLWDDVVGRSLGFSGIRLANAEPRTCAAMGGSGDGCVRRR